MPYQIKPEANFLRLRFTGRVTRAEFDEAIRELLALETAAPRVPDRLIDLCELEISELRAEDIQALAKGRRETRFANPFRSAILAPNPAQFGYGRMFQILNHHPDITVEVFTEEAAALAWLQAH